MQGRAFCCCLLLILKIIFIRDISVLALFLTLLPGTLCFGWTIDHSLAKNKLTITTEDFQSTNPVFYCPHPPFESAANN